jgi:hypothetical protein
MFDHFFGKQKIKPISFSNIDMKTISPTFELFEDHRYFNDQMNNTEEPVLKNRFVKTTILYSCAWMEAWVICQLKNHIANLSIEKTGPQSDLFNFISDETFTVSCPENWNNIKDRFEAWTWTIFRNLNYVGFEGNRLTYIDEKLYRRHQEVFKRYYSITAIRNGIAHYSYNKFCLIYEKPIYNLANQSFEINKRLLYTFRTIYPEFVIPDYYQ